MAGSDNLTPYVKGQSGNPAGKPKGTKNRQTIVRELIQAIHIDGLRTNEEAMTVAVINKALAGDVTAWEKLMDSAHGKVTDKVAVSAQVTNMGRVTAVPVGNPAEEIPLTFNVGEEPQNVENEDE